MLLLVDNNLLLNTQKGSLLSVIFLPLVTLFSFFSVKRFIISLTVSSIINEVIRALFYFFYKKISQPQKSTKRLQANKNKNAPKKHLRRKIVTYWVICIFVPLAECLRAD